MRAVKSLLAVTSFLIPGLACAQAACASGQARLKDGDPCIPSHLVNYLYCLGGSGGGRVEVKKKEDASSSKQLEVTIGGKGSGVVIRGEGSGSVKNAEVTRVLKELDEKLDPSLTKNCKELASPPKAALPPLPPFDEASGTAEAEVLLPPQPTRLWAKLSGTATAHISQGGWMEVRISANDQECKPARVYKNPTSGNMHTATATCTIELKPKVPYTFKITAPNHNADAHAAKIAVNYWR